MQCEVLKLIAQHNVDVCHCHATLQELDISLLPIHMLALDCANLRALNLRGSYKLHACSIHCHAPLLERVDLCGTHIDAGAFGTRGETIMQGGLPLQWRGS
jgi:hypothetical protein